MRRAALLLAASLLCTQALADEPTSPQADPRPDLDLDLRASSFGPYGVLGLSLAYAPNPALAVELGGGWSPTGKGGSTLDLTAALQLRHPIVLENLHTLTPYLGLALSYTPEHQNLNFCLADDCPDDVTSQHNLWPSLELGGILELDDAWRLGLHLGVAYHLYASSTTITSANGNPREGDTQRFLYPHLGLRVGFDLGL